MGKKRKKREYEDEDVVDFSGYPPWLKIFIVFIIAFVLITAFVPGWILYTVITIVVVSFIAVSYWFYKNRGINVPKQLVKSSYEGYKKLHEDWEKELMEKEPKKGEKRKVVPPLSESEVSRIKVKYGHKCMWSRCNEEVELDVHHILPRSKGGSNKEKNLIVLCPNHHRKASKIPRKTLYLMRQQWKR